MSRGEKIKKILELVPECPVARKMMPYTDTDLTKILGAAGDDLIEKVYAALVAEKLSK